MSLNRHVQTATGRCSSMRLSKPIPRRSGCGAPSAFRSSPRCRRRFVTRYTDTLDSTSCISRCEAKDALISEECVRMAVPLVRPAWSVKGFNRCDRDQILNGTGQLPVEGDQRVRVELGQCDVLGVEGVGPPEQDGGFPCDVLK